MFWRKKGRLGVPRKSSEIIWKTPDDGSDDDNLEIIVFYWFCIVFKVRGYLSSWKTFEKLWFVGWLS